MENWFGRKSIETTTPTTKRFGGDNFVTVARP
jgi:hypothetical protein